MSLFSNLSIGHVHDVRRTGKLIPSWRHDTTVIASRHENQIDMKIIVHSTDKMSSPSLSSVTRMVDESKA
jgi:hypothetical protein